MDITIGDVVRLGNEPGRLAVFVSYRVNFSEIPEMGCVGLLTLRYLDTGQLTELNTDFLQNAFDKGRFAKVEGVQL